MKVIVDEKQKGRAVSSGHGADIKARLWRIGSSVVFTIPAELDEMVRADYVEVSLAVNGNPVVYLMKPWKCGGSRVLTVPKQYRDAYNLDSIVKRKDSVSVSLKAVA
jgi:hypothetical protein